MDTPTDPPSPYQPPAADLSQPYAPPPNLPPHERSGAPKVFGVLSIIFSSLVLLGSAFGLLAGVATSAASMGASSGDPDKAADVAATIGLMGPMTNVYKGIALQCLLLFVMSVLLLVIGIGQVRYRAWARRWSVTWGVAGLVSVAAMVAISMLIISPAYGAFFDSLSRLKPQPGEAIPPSMGAMSSLFGGTFAVLTVIFYAPYPALMLLFFTRDRVRASMTT
jgi:hypothetical protein